MIRWRAVPAVLGTAFLVWVAPAAAAVSRPDDSRAVTSSDRQSEIDGSALDTLLERSGLKVQLESLAAGVRVQFLLGRARLSGEDRLTIDRIVSRRFSSAALYARIRLEFQRNLESGKMAKALEWNNSPLGKRSTGIEIVSLMIET